MMSSEIQHLGNKLVEKSVQMLDRLLIRRKQFLEGNDDPNLIIGGSRPRLTAVLRNIFEGRRWPYERLASCPRITETLRYYSLDTTDGRNKTNTCWYYGFVEREITCLFTNSGSRSSLNTSLTNSDASLEGKGWVTLWETNILSREE